MLESNNFVTMFNKSIAYDYSNDSKRNRFIYFHFKSNKSFLPFQNELFHLVSMCGSILLKVKKTNQRKIFFYFTLLPLLRTILSTYVKRIEKRKLYRAANVILYRYFSMPISHFKMETIKNCLYFIALCAIFTV